MPNVLKVVVINELKENVYEKTKLFLKVTTLLSFLKGCFYDFRQFLVRFFALILKFELNVN